MKVLLIVIIAFLVLVYAYTYIKHKKRRQNQISAVDAFRNTYLNKEPKKPVQNSTDEDLKKYITKYNSSVDYVDWNDFVQETMDQKNSTEKKTTKIRRIQY